MSRSGVLKGERVLRRALRRGSKKGLSRRHIEGRNTPFRRVKSPGTPAGCPWDTRQDKQGSTGRCPRNFLLLTIEDLPFLPGHRPGVPGTPGRPGDFHKIYVIFSYVPFLLPIENTILFKISTRMKLLFSNDLGVTVTFFQGSSELITITIQFPCFPSRMHYRK